MCAAMKENDNIDGVIKSYRPAIIIKPHYAQAHRHLSFALHQDAKFKDRLDEYE